MATINEISFGITEKVKNRKYSGGSQEHAAIQCKFNEVLIALHDAINSPKGIVPKSADDFYSHRHYVEIGEKNG